MEVLRYSREELELLAVILYRSGRQCDNEICIQRRSTCNLREARIISKYMQKMKRREVKMLDKYKKDIEKKEGIHRE